MQRIRSTHRYKDDEENKKKKHKKKKKNKNKKSSKKKKNKHLLGTYDYYEKPKKKKKKKSSKKKDKKKKHKKKKKSYNPYKDKCQYQKSFTGKLLDAFDVKANIDVNISDQTVANCVTGICKAIGNLISPKPPALGPGNDTPNN